MSNAPDHRAEAWRLTLLGMTQRPTTMAEVWGRIAQAGMVKTDPGIDVASLWPGCVGVAVYQSRRGKLYAVVRYVDGSLTWGSA